MDQTETELTVGAGKKKSRAPVETRKLLLAVRTDKSVGPSNFFILRSSSGLDTERKLVFSREREREREPSFVFLFQKQKKRKKKERPMKAKAHDFEIPAKIYEHGQRKSQFLHLQSHQHDTKGTSSLFHLRDTVSNRRFLADTGAAVSVFPDRSSKPCTDLTLAKERESDGDYAATRRSQIDATFNGRRR